MKRIVSLLALALLLAVAAAAQMPRPQYVRAQAAPVEPVAPGRKLEVPVRLEITKGFHINSSQPTFDYLIPTKLEWNAGELKLLAVNYPPPGKRAFSFSPGKPLEVYEGVVDVFSRFEVPRGLKPGKRTLTAAVKYQACDDSACYPPATVTVEVPVEIAAGRPPAASPAKPSRQTNRARRPAP